MCVCVCVKKQKKNKTEKLVTFLDISDHSQLKNQVEDRNYNKDGLAEEFHLGSY